MGTRHIKVTGDNKTIRTNLVGWSGGEEEGGSYILPNRQTNPDPMHHEDHLVWSLSEGSCDPIQHGRVGPGQHENCDCASGMHAQVWVLPCSFAVLAAEC